MTRQPAPAAADASPRLPGRYYLRLLALAGVESGPESNWVRALGLSDAELNDPLATVSLDAVERTLARLRRRGLAPEFGLELGRAIQPEEHHILGHALLQARTIEAALQLAARYFALLSPGFRLRLQRGPATCRVEIIPWLGFSTEALRLHLDVVLAALWRMLHALSGASLPAAEVRVSWDRPDYATRYAALRPWRIRFGAAPRPGFELDLAATWLRTPRPEADSIRLDAAEARCRDLINSARRSARLADWTSMMLEAGSSQPSIQELAELAGMSVRTLRRHLEREGHAFRDISLAARMRRAESALLRGLPVGEVTQLCGYSDASNFSRAFRRRFGHPPSSTRGGTKPA